jgi:hypothetical protein
MNNCTSNHALCSLPSETLPSRVIKVGSEHTDPELYVPGNTHGRYTALSHCWGGSQVTKTTTLQSSCGNADLRWNASAILNLSLSYTMDTLIC